MTQQQENDKHDLGIELNRCMVEGDKQMAYQIYMYMLSEKYITEDEAFVVKTALEQHFGKYEDKNSEANKIMLQMVSKIGLPATRVLWRLIEQFPTKCLGDPANMEFLPNNDKIIKETNIPSVSYYEIIQTLIDHDYMSKRIEKKHLVYKIHFDKIRMDE